MTGKFKEIYAIDFSDQEAEPTGNASIYFEADHDPDYGFDTQGTLQHSYRQIEDPVLT